MGAILRGAVLGGLAGAGVGAYAAPRGKGWQGAGVGAGLGLVGGGFAGKGVKLGIGAARTGWRNARSWRSRLGSTSGPMQGPIASGAWQGPVQRSNRPVNSYRDAVGWMTPGTRASGIGAPSAGMF